jgi:hypothetical protein|nr:MAG TPA: hypothetical protein [Caudoviricetes sp.]
MKTVDYTLIEKYYDEKLSKKENLEQLKAKGIEVGKTSLYNYCKDKGISDRLGEDELRHLINPMQTVRQNLDLLKGQGYRIGNKKVCKILKEAKNTYRPSEYEKQPKTEILSTPKPTLNDIVGLDKFLSSLTPNINEDTEKDDKPNNVAEMNTKVNSGNAEKDTEPVVEEVKPTVQEDSNPLCNLKFDFAKLMGDF